MARSWADWHLIVISTSYFADMCSFQNDECLALAIDSTNPDAADCYQIVPERTQFKLERMEQIASGQNGTTNYAIAISQPYDAVALLNLEGKKILMFRLIEGFLQIKPDGDILGRLSSYSKVRPSDPISISFNDSGDKLFFLRDVHSYLN
jgi:hypothetical protein